MAAIFLMAAVIFSPTLFLSAEEIPEGFKAQELSPLGGEITMPISWHYSGGMTSNGFMFVISKEKNEDGHYETGMRIQGIADVKKRSGLSAYDAANYNKQKFKKAAKRIIKECSDEDSGLFKKTCLETIEVNGRDPQNDFHVIYSFFWDEKMDMMITSIFGSPEKKWGEAEKIYNVMQSFTIIDVKKIEEESKQKQRSQPDGASKRGLSF